MTHQATDTASAALRKLIASWEKRADLADWPYTAALRDCAGELETALASLPAPAAPCGAKHDSTQAVCELPVGHAQNHRGPFAHGTAQWPAPAAPGSWR